MSSPAEWEGSSVAFKEPLSPLLGLGSDCIKLLRTGATESSAWVWVRSVATESAAWVRVRSVATESA